MGPFIKKYIGIEKVEAIAREKSYDEISYKEFIWFLEKDLKQEVSDEYEMDQETIDESLDYVDGYMNKFVKKKTEGYSIKWIRASIREEEYPDGLEDIFKEVQKFKKKQAITDLRLYSKLNNRDEFFIKCFINLMNGMNRRVGSSREEQAIAYSEIYKEQIKEGKTEIFANQYALCKSIYDGVELYCFSYASEYEKAISKGYTAIYAMVFSDLMAEYIDRYYNNYERALEDESAKWKRGELEKEKGYLK